MLNPRAEGPLEDANRFLASSNTRFAAGLVLLAVALDAVLNEGTLMAGSGRAAVLVLLALSMGVAAIRRRSYGVGLSATGLLLIALAPGDGLRGEVALGGAEAPEAVLAGSGQRSAPYHLGGALYAQDGEAGSVELSLRTGERLHASVSVPLDGQGGAHMAGWNWRVSRRAVGEDLSQVRVEFKARTGDGKQPAIVQTLTVGQSFRLPDQTLVKVLRLTGDFGKSLGAAAWLEFSWAQRKEAAWHFVDAPGLDARVGVTPWATRVLRIEPGRALTLQATRSQNPTGAQLGWGAVGLGILLSSVAGLRRRSAS